MIARRILEKLNASTSSSDVLIGKYFTLKNGKRIVITQHDGDKVQASQVLNGKPVPNSQVSIPVDKLSQIVLN